jgi:hypothetical protein
MAQKLYSVNALADELGLDRRTIKRRLVNVTPDRGEGTNRPTWYMTTVRSHLGADEALDLTKERARLASEQADKQAMDNAQRRGEVAPMSYYEEKIESYARQLMAVLNVIPPLIRQTLPHMTHIDHARIETIFAREQDRLADRLASGGEESKGGGRASSGPDSEATAA